ncbi:hypothetical protein QYE76_034418 [Lolium multiflorum]|uniref:Gag-pol polyprotein n=1 Tax=Lolium multiflorum TaxID=4521 RepID=A0AAD8VN27_LOLMU|nr:hypothetical protein QYE76_034418 [Lolium multiflorum]
MTEAARRGRRGEPRWAQTTGRRGPWPDRATLWCGGPQPLSPPFLRVLLRPENLSHREDLTKGYSRLCGAENTREKRALRRAGIHRGNSLPEGEIDAIAIVIELDIISIIIIIISTIYTAITTAAPRHRCISMNEVRKKLFTISLSGKAAHWYKLLKNGDSIDWEDIVPLFYSKFYPPNKTLLDTSCSGSFTRNKEEFKRDLLDRIQENTEGWENDKDRESGIIYDYKCIEAFMDTDKFRNMSATYGLDSQVVANLYKAFASHYELPKKNFDKYHEPYKDKVDSSVNKCVVIETVDNVIPEAYIEKTPFPAKMKEYSVISSAVNKSEKKPKEPEEQIKIEPAVAIVKDLVTENVEDGHIIFCEDASNIVSHPNKPKQVSVPMLSVRIGDHCYYGLCDIGASVSAIPYELYTEIMHEIGSCELEDIDVVIHLANRETISPIGIVRDVEVLCGKIKYPADFLVLGSAANMASPINFNQFLEKEKLKSNGSNFTDWFRHVRIFLNGGNLQYVLDAPLGDPPAETETDEVKNVYATRKTRYSQVQCAILCSLESDLQKRFEHHDPHELMKELKTIFETHAAVECYEASKHFFSCMMEEGSSISEHMLVMTGHAKKLSDLGIVIPNRLGINRVLQSLPPSYKNFVMNYNMQNMNKEFPELFGMLKAAEIEIKKEHQVLMVNKTTSFKKQGKSKGKFKKGGKKAATPPMKPKNGPKPDADCYYCKEKGHWKRNCSKYLADLKSGLVKKKKEGISDIHVIDVNFTGSRSSTWVFDTGSVAHICNSKQELKNKRQLLKDEVTMRVGNGSKVNVIAVGTLPLHLPSGLVLSLNNCYYVPALSMNIISGSCLMQDGYSFKSENNGCSIFMNNIFYGRAPEKNGLFLLDLDSSDTHIHNIDAKRIKLNDNSTYMWHCRLGHIGVKRMKKLHTDGLLESLDFESLDRCEACLMGKMTKTPFSGMMERATDLLEIIHTDVCGPMSVASRGGYRYVLTFTDDLSRYGYIYLMKHKSETFEKFKEFQSEVENQRNKKIKFLRSDRGGEYLSYEFGMHLKKCGILSQLTPPGTPQRNGVSERRNRTLLDMVRSMMSLTDLPLSFWSYALETAAFTLNRAPSKSVETTPYELWFNKKPKLSFLKVWGCEAYVKKLQPDKLEPKAEKCVFIGYPKETIGYTFYHRSEGKIFVAKNGTFLEKEFLTKEVTGRKVELDEIEESLLVDQSSAVPENVPVPPTPTTEEANDNDHETSNETATEPRRSTRDRATPDWYDPCLNVMIVDNNDEDPATYEEAMMSPDSNKWQEAMKSEMGSMYDNKVWTLVDLPDSRKAVENKWIFKRKTDADGNITVYKARLVAKGFRQIQGVDYDETFSPVAKLKSVRILLAIAAFFDYEIWQMDVKTAFLNGDIEEELYMVQPKGFVDPKNADKVCKLQRSIYGLKQASRSWNRRFDKVIKDFGFIQCHGEACIYKKVSGSSVAFLILYVDDILLIGNDIELLSSVKGYLNNSFSMKDLGEASYILGIKIYRDRSRRLIGLSQSTYLDKILKKFRMDESKKGFLPMLPGKVLSKTQGPATAEERERMSQIPYASAVGSIMYAMLCTRPDIAHAVSLTSRYQSDPGMEHWTAVKNILKYLKRTKDMFLCYGVSWASSKQCTVAKSSTESEYIAAQRLHQKRLAKLRRTSTPPPTPRRRAVGFKRSYYFRCPLEREVDVVFINNRTCDRVRRCCPFVAPEPIVIKIFYALLQAASERLPQQQEPPLVGFGISSRVSLDNPLVATIF